MWARKVTPVIVAAALSCAAVEAQDLPDGSGAGIVRSRCLGCHGFELITQQRLSRDSWSRELDKMAGWGAVIAAAERDALLAYLTVKVGAVPGPPAADDIGDRLLIARCTGCHDLRLIEQQRLDDAGWRRELEKMIGWGAALTTPDREALVAHLARQYPVRR